MPNNPYIDLVKDHEHIFYKPEDLHWHAGKWDKYFGNSQDLYLEIGTGLGNFFSKQVSENPDKNYIWMEIRYKRLYQTAEKCLWNKSNYSQSQTLSSKMLTSHFSDKPHPQLLSSKRGEYWENFLLLKEFGQKISQIFGSWELSWSYIFFPDPWARKKSQLKNRLLQRSFLIDLYSTTKDSGTCIIKTDHRGYFDFLLEELQHTKWKQIYISYDFESEPEFQNAETTEFQQLFRGQDQKIHHIELQK